jgi:hypothetical protein
MLPKTRLLLAALIGVALLAGSVQAADLTESLKKGTPDIKSVGALTFGPDGVLFAGDPQGAAIFAFDTQDQKPVASNGAIKIEKIDQKVAAVLGTTPQQMLINDVAVNPASGNLYLSVSRGAGPAATPVIVKIDRTGKISELSLKDVKFAKAALPNPSERSRQEAITDLAFVKDKVIVAGLSNEEFASNLRAIPFPFTEANKGASVEIYHGAHGAFETRSPVRTFAVYDIKGDTHLLAAYTCTPLVKFPVSDLKPGTKVKGTTIAELGNRNRPLDMVVYQKGGKDFVLIANSSRGMMKVTTENIDKIEGITKKINGVAGLTYETIESLKGVQQMDKLDKDNAVVLIRTEGGDLNLDTVPLP